MSYYVRFETVWDGEGFNHFNSSDLARVMARVEEYIRSERTYDFDDWRDEFQQAFAGEPAMIKYVAKEWATGLLLYLSRHFPGTVFGARGTGEDLDDLWVVWALDSRVWAARPWNDASA